MALLGMFVHDHSIRESLQFMKTHLDIEDMLSDMARRCGLNRQVYRSSDTLIAVHGQPTSGLKLWEHDPERDTGRTTRIILLGLTAVEAGHHICFASATLTQAELQMTLPARKYARQAGLDGDLIHHGISWGGHPSDVVRNASIQGMHHLLIFVDHSHITGPMIRNI